MLFNSGEFSFFQTLNLVCFSYRSLNPMAFQKLSQIVILVLNLDGGGGDGDDDGG